MKYDKEFLKLICCYFRARQEQLERQAEIQRKKEEEVQRKLEEKNKSLSSAPVSSSWRNLDKAKEDSKTSFGSRDKDRRDGGFARTRDDGPPSERRPVVFSRGGDDRKGGTAFSSRDNDRGGWNRGTGGGGSTGGSAFENKTFSKDGPREGGRTAFDRDTPRKRDIPSSNDVVNYIFLIVVYY